MFALDPEQAYLWRRLLIMAGFSTALLFAWVNRRSRLMRLLALGLVLNLAPMLANGGLMPVTPENAIRAGFAEEIARLEAGDAVPRSKDVLKAEDDTILAPLTDVIVLPRWFPGRAVASAGDAVVATAVLLAVAATFKSFIDRILSSRPRRESHALNASRQT
jgi:hypothetical protein